MIIVLLYCLTVLIGSIPFNVWLNPKIELKNKNSSEISVSASPFMTYYSLSLLLQFTLGYGITLLLQNRLYYDNDIFLIIGLLLLISSHCWPIFNGFKPNKHPLFLITGMMSTFYTPFIWIIPCCYLIFSIVLNSQYIAYLVTILSLLVFYLLVDNIPNTFLFLTIGTFIVFIVLFYTNIFNVLENKTNTLYTQFINRI